MMETTEIPVQDSQSTETEIEAQTYLERKYPTLADKVNCHFLNLGTKNENNPESLEVKLTGSLDLTGFTNLKTLWCGGHKITQLNLSDCSRLEELKCWENELTELNLSNCLQLKKLNCSSNKLTNLDLTNCEKLEHLNCEKNQLIQLTLPSQLTNLETLVCQDNFLTDLDWAALPGEKLTVLGLQNNNFSAQDLSFLAKFTNLKELYLFNENPVKISQGIYNRWIGSLRPLQNMKQLHKLNIDNTDLDSGTEYLPVSVIEISCSYFFRSESKVKLVVKELESVGDFRLVNFGNKIYAKKKLPLEILEQIKDFNHKNLTPEQEKLLEELIPSKNWRDHYKRNGLCANCQQLNGREEWCQFCNLPYLQADFANWTSGKEEIDKLIQKCQLEAGDRNNLLEWIPYEQFSDIEYLAEGGFGKIYKAKLVSGLLRDWNTKDNKWERWAKNVDIVLKILTNSQNMTTEFLQEIINHKLVAKDNYSLIVNCFGISQEPESGNYVMVMRYIPQGNLRQFLKSNYKKLSFSDRLFQLLEITHSLLSIHQSDLVHQDFHPGNVLNYTLNNSTYSYVTDLGLSRPAQETNKEQIYGVLPYVAPEVLCGKKYTQRSDIYSLGMIAYELFSNQPPLAEYAYNSALVLRICEGLRPNLAEMIAPQLLKDLISRCWDADPKQRPTADELFLVLVDWVDFKNYFLKKNTELYYQYQKLLVTKELDSLTNKPPRNYSTNKYTSRRLDFPNLPQPQNSKELNQRFYNSQEIDLGFSKEFNDLWEKTTSREFNLIDNFAELNIQENSQKENPYDINQWKNIHPNFIPELVNSWISHGFTPQQCQDWININSPPQQEIAIQEPEYYTWLRDVKKVDSEWVHNYGDSGQLRQEFRQWEQLKTQIQIPLFQGKQTKEEHERKTQHFSKKSEENSPQLVQINKEIQELESEINSFSEPLKNEPANLVKRFVRLNKKIIEDKSNENVRNEIIKLDKKLLEDEILSEESIDKILHYCERLVDLEWQKDHLRKTADSQTEFQSMIEIPFKK